jgi:hypothetical protein
MSELWENDVEGVARVCEPDRRMVRTIREEEVDEGADQESEVGGGR